MKVIYLHLHSLEFKKISGKSYKITDYDVFPIKNIEFILPKKRISTSYDFNDQC